MSNGLEFSKSVDPRFYQQPGFVSMHDAWLEVFEKDANGKYTLDPAEALVKVMDARRTVGIEESGTDSLTDLEHVACRYAREITFSVGEISA